MYIIHYNTIAIQLSHHFPNDSHLILQKKIKTTRRHHSAAIPFPTSAQSRSDTKPVVSQGPKWHPGTAAPRIGHVDSLW